MERNYYDDRSLHSYDPIFWTPTRLMFQDIKPETALQQLWTRTSNAGNENTEDQSHSPSVDSGSSSATDGEGGDKEQQVNCLKLYHF